MPVGHVVEDRFRIQAFLRSEAGTDLYQAVDSQGGAMVFMRFLNAPPSARPMLESDVTKAAGIAHHNLSSIVAFGAYQGVFWVANDAEDAHSLRDVIEAKRAQGQAVGATYAQTMLGHVANALEEAHKVMPHGCLSPESIWVTRAGRVKVGDLGFVRAFPALARRGGPPGGPEGIYAAPEVTRDGSPNPTSDVYSMGLILYELITGVTPIQPLRPATQVARDLPHGVDALIAKAIAANPPSRFGGPGELMQAFAAATGAGGAAGGADTAGRLTLGRSFNVAQASGLAENDERWLVHKDRLDYGPFSLAQIMAQIERGDFKSDHMIVDVDSGERQRIKEHPLLGEFALDAERKLEAVRRAQADHVQEHVERKKSRATVAIVGVAVVALGLGLAFYLKNRKAAQENVLAERVSESDVDEFLKNVKLDIAQKKRVATRRGGPGGGRSDDFSGVTNFGDVTQGGGDEILSDQLVQKVMMGNYRKLVPCIMAERRQNSRLSEVDIEFVVLGSGKVSAVRVNGQQRGVFPACVLGRMQSFGFPSYNGKKTIASWSMAMR